MVWKPMHRLCEYMNHINCIDYVNYTNVTDYANYKVDTNHTENIKILYGKRLYHPEENTRIL